MKWGIISHEGQPDQIAQIANGAYNTRADAIEACADYHAKQMNIHRNELRRMNRMFKRAKRAEN